MEYTDRAFWRNYWLQKPDLFNKPIDRKSLFLPLFQDLVSKNNFTSAVEIGGFPGTFSVLMQLEYGIPTDLVDYFVDQALLNQFIAANEFESKKLNAYEIDVFTDFVPPKRYDLVFSIGLIEHFDDTKRIVQGHVKFMNDNGVLLIIIPNFRGINGWFQRTFDIENYNKHYIACMDAGYLRPHFGDFKEVEIDYFGGFSIWLENYKTQNVMVKLFFKSVWLLGKVLFKVFKPVNRFFSPYIYIKASNFK
jgi:SAM-dependent methyltransferase